MRDSDSVQERQRWSWVKDSVKDLLKSQDLDRASNMARTERAKKEVQVELRKKTWGNGFS